MQPLSLPSSDSDNDGDGDRLSLGHSSFSSPSYAKNAGSNTSASAGNAVASTVTPNTIRPTPWQETSSKRPGDAAATLTPRNSLNRNPGLLSSSNANSSNGSVNSSLLSNSGAGGSSGGAGVGANSHSNSNRSSSSSSSSRAGVGNGPNRSDNYNVVNNYSNSFAGTGCSVTGSNSYSHSHLNSPTSSSSNSNGVPGAKHLFTNPNNVNASSGSSCTSPSNASSISNSNCGVGSDRSRVAGGSNPLKVLKWSIIAGVSLLTLIVGYNMFCDPDSSTQWVFLSQLTLSSNDLTQSNGNSNGHSNPPAHGHRYGVPRPPGALPTLNGNDDTDANVADSSVSAEQQRQRRRQLLMQASEPLEAPSPSRTRERKSTYTYSHDYLAQLEHQWRDGICTQVRTIMAHTSAILHHISSNIKYSMQHQVNNISPDFYHGSVYLLCLPLRML